MSVTPAEALWKTTFMERFKELVGDTPYRVLSDRLGVSKSTICAYLAGDRTPKVDVLKRIAAEYGVSTKWLMGMDVPKYEDETLAREGEGLSEDRAYLWNRITTLSDDEVRSLRTIVDQVLSLRGK